MKAVRWLHLLLCLLVLLGFAAVVTPFANAQTIRALVVGSDSDAEVQYAKNVNKIVKLLNEIENEDICEEIDIVRFDAERASETPTPERIKAWLEDVNPTSNDIVFVYYSRTHRTDEESVDLEDLTGRVSEMSARLKIFITATDLELIDDAEGIDDLDVSDVSASALRDLFIEHKGFLRLTSNSSNELSFGDTANGGWFTQALIDAIVKTTDANGFVTWAKVLEKTQETTKKLYEKNSPKFSDELEEAMEHFEKSQTPVAHGTLPTTVATVHALLVVEDTADVAEESVAALNHKRMKGFFMGAENHGICDVMITSLLSSENAATAEKVKAWTEAVNLGENDTVFIYYSANDSDPTAADRQEELVKSLEKAIQSENIKKSRLQMLIIDTYRIGPAKNVPRFGLPYPQTTFHNLFLEHKGVLRLVSRSKDELSFADAYSGGWFTRTLVETIYEIREREDFPSQVPNNNRDRKFLEWEELVEEVRDRTTAIFEESYPDGFEDAENYPETVSDEDRQNVLDALDEDGVRKSQTPKAHELPKKM